MPREWKIAYFAHTIRSDWNNGNAHFLRGLMRALTAAGQDVTIYEPDVDWSIEHLQQESLGQRSLEEFESTYPELKIELYRPDQAGETEVWRKELQHVDLVMVHEWNPPALAHTLLSLRDELGFRALFHDTHHRASSSPEQIELFGLDRFDGVLAFGDALRRLYRERFAIENVWTFHEAADVTVFRPLEAPHKEQDIVWIGNWGEGERSTEIRRFLLDPAAALPQYSTHIYGVRYPEDGLAALRKAGVRYGGYLPNLSAPAVFAASQLTVHVPRQQYSAVMTGIPTIRIFEALACGIPLISAPWQDSEGLFREGDFTWAGSTDETIRAMERLLTDTDAAQEQAARGLETVLAHHTCDHRARQLLEIAEELFD